MSDEKTKLTPADAVRIVEAYEGLRERAIMIMKLPEFRDRNFRDDAFCIRACTNSDRWLVVEFHSAEDDSACFNEITTYEQPVPAELFEMGNDDFILHEAMLRRQNREREEQKKIDQAQAAEAKERAEYERLRKKFEEPKR